eukprot:jgi/Chrzof1/7166/Cz02g13160.t1
MSDKQSEGKESARENLGWLASSTLPARKRRHIEGVSTSGIVELQAQLYRTQEHVRQRQDGSIDVHDKHVRPSAGPSMASIIQRRNAGVDARDARDKLQLKATGEGAERLAESQAALARKAQLYEKLARGEQQDDEEKYEVEFWRKGGSLDDEAPQAGNRFPAAHVDDWLQPSTSQQQRAVDSAAAVLSGSGQMMTADMER